jgi:Vacuolar protein sorting-associated protein 62
VTDTPSVRFIFAALALLGTLVLVPVSGAKQPQVPSLATLLARHVPILVLHPAERFEPVPVDGFLADSDVQRKGASGWETIPGPPPAGGRNLRLDQRLCKAIEGPAASPCYQAAQDVHGAKPVVYGKAFRSESRIDLQYWIWYPYNDYSPTIPPGDVWQVHEGDWESVSVILDRQGRPLLVALSRHCAGARRAWARSPKRDRRPLVHVALGSHANYYAAGTYPHDPSCWPRELRDVVRALKLVDRTENGRTVRPTLVPVTPSSPAWMRFAGAWGEDGYVRFPNNDPIAYRAGPPGPDFHEQWRNPVALELSWPRG